MGITVNFWLDVSAPKQKMGVPPPIGEAVEDTEMGKIGEYTTCRPKSVAQYIYTWKILILRWRRRVGKYPLRSCAGGNRREYGLGMRGGGCMIRRWIGNKHQVFLNTI